MHLNILSTTTTNNFNDPQQEEKITDYGDKIPKRLKQLFNKESQYFAFTIVTKVIIETIMMFLYILNRLNESTQFDTTTLQWQEYAVDPEDEYGIVNAWKRIWADEEADKLNRTYQFDYEQYDAQGQVTIQIGIKKE